MDLISEEGSIGSMSIIRGKCCYVDVVRVLIRDIWREREIFGINVWMIW